MLLVSLKDYCHSNVKDGLDGVRNKHTGGEIQSIGKIFPFTYPCLEYALSFSSVYGSLSYLLKCNSNVTPP